MFHSIFDPVGLYMGRYPGKRNKDGPFFSIVRQIGLKVNKYSLVIGNTAKNPLHGVLCYMLKHKHPDETEVKHA